VEELWSDYLRAVSNRNPISMYRCYEDALTEQIEKGSPPLVEHLNDMFSLLVRDYDCQLLGESKEGDSKVVRKLRFRHRKKNEELITEVVFREQGMGWHISRYPAPPPFVALSGKTIAALVGIGIVVLAVIIIAKKYLA
jgi:hypothetical protein